jgi:hypothetical protein
MERQVRRLFNCEPSVDELERQTLFTRLADLDLRLERLALRAASSTIDLEHLEETGVCARDLYELERCWAPDQRPIGLLDVA